MTTQKKPSDAALRRGAARLAAVQATYQLSLTDGRIDDVLSDLISGAIGGEVIAEDPDLETEEVVPLIEMHAELFSVLVRGVDAMKTRLDEVIDASLGTNWDSTRLEPLTRSILRCGLYELLERPTMPARGCISEYVDITRSFFEGAEPGMVNAVLDKLARQIRPEEMEAARRPRPADGA